MIVALVIGISAAIYLSEYSRDTHFIRLIRVAILNLAGAARGRVDDRSPRDRNQCRDLSERIQPRHALYSLHSRRHLKSRRRAFDRVRPVRFWTVRDFFWLERVADRGVVHARSHDFAGD